MAACRVASCTDLDVQRYSITKGHQRVFLRLLAWQLQAKAQPSIGSHACTHVCTHTPAPMAPWQHAPGNNRASCQAGHATLLVPPLTSDIKPVMHLPPPPADATDPGARRRLAGRGGAARRPRQHLRHRTARRPDALSAGRRAQACVEHGRVGDVAPPRVGAALRKRCRAAAHGNAVRMQPKHGGAVRSAACAVSQGLRLLHVQACLSACLCACVHIRVHTHIRVRPSSAFLYADTHALRERGGGAPPTRPATCCGQWVFVLPICVEHVPQHHPRRHGGRQPPPPPLWAPMQGREGEDDSAASSAAMQLGLVPSLVSHVCYVSPIFMRLAWQPRLGSGRPAGALHAWCISTANLAVFHRLALHPC